MSTLSSALAKLGILPKVVAENDSSVGQTSSPNALDPGDKTYNADSSPPGTKHCGQSETFSGAAITIDLTDLVDDEGRALDGSGLKVQEILIQAGGDNVAAVVISGGDADPYELFGSGKSLNLLAGMKVQLRCNDQLDDIATGTGAGESDIKFSGTTSDTFSYQLILG